MSTKSKIRLIKKADRVPRRKESKSPQPKTATQQERATAALINGWVDDLREKSAGVSFKDQVDDQTR